MIDNGMVIVYAATRNLYPYLPEIMQSLVDTNRDYLREVVLFAEDDAIPYKLPCSVRVINVASRKEDVQKPNGPNADSIFSWMAFVRLLYCELLPEHDRVIQLDIDTIVCDDLRPIWEIDLAGKWFAACDETRAYTYKPYGPKYYNVGVCVFNLAQMRKDNIVPTLLHFVNTEKAYCVEQDALNKYGIAQHKIVDMPQRYNECFATIKSDNPAIVHYASYGDWYLAKPGLPRREYLLKYRVHT